MEGSGAARAVQMVRAALCAQLLPPPPLSAVSCACACVHCMSTRVPVCVSVNPCVCVAADPHTCAHVHMPLLLHVFAHVRVRVLAGCRPMCALHV